MKLCDVAVQRNNCNQRPRKTGCASFMSLRGSGFLLGEDLRSSAPAEQGTLVRMASVLLLLLVASASAWSTTYRYFGGSVNVCPKGRDAHGFFEVELRHKQGTFLCFVNPYTCKYGNCGIQAQTSSVSIAWESYRLTWCQKEVVVKLKLPTNLPFGVRFPSQFSYSDGRGYWMPNVIGPHHTWRMLAHVDLGIRSDTGDFNSPPVSTMLPIVRVTRNCPRRLDLTVFDQDDDRVRCRVATSRRADECGICRLPHGFSLDQDSCSLSYSSSGKVGLHPVELVVEDFPRTPIQLSYSNGQYSLKGAPPASRFKRQADLGFDSSTTAAPTTPTSTTYVPISTTTTPTTTTPTSTTTTTTTYVPISTTTTPTTTTPTSTTTTTTTYVPISTTTTPTTTTPTSTTTTTTTYVPIITTTTPTTTTPTTTTYIPISTTTTPTTTTPTTTATSAPPDTSTSGLVLPPLQSYVPWFPLYASHYRPSIAPLSKLPLQFSVLVDPHDAPSCLHGDYFPAFLSPTPAHGTHLPVLVGQTLEFQIRVEAQYTTIYRLLLTGPGGIHHRSTSTGSYVVKWTPSESDLNCHFPICFVSEAYDGRRQVYHSDLRCLVVDVVRYNAVVTCGQTEIKVEVEKTYLMRRYEDRLHLRDEHGTPCRLATLSNSSHLVAVMPLNACGTYIQDDEENLTFRNQISSSDPEDIISRHNDVDIAICCVYPKRSNVTLGFRHKNPYAFKERGFGSFTFQLEFFQSQRFRQQVEASTYPVEVYLQQMIYMQIQATSSIPDTELFVESCKATPYDNPDSRISYTIIEDGCVKDPTVQVYPGSRSVFRFGMEAFQFIGAHDQVYISCSVLLCDSGAPDTRCSQGCVPAGSRRRRREAVAQTSRHSISQGPLHLKAPDSEDSGLSLSLVLNLVFILGSVLVCGAVIYRSRRSGAKYQRLPSSDSG